MLQELVHLRAGNTAPDHPKPGGIGIFPEGGDIAILHLKIRAIPGIGPKMAAHLERNSITAGQLLNRQDCQPVGLLHVGSHLGQQLVRRDADGARQAFADLALDFTLDAVCQLFRYSGLLLHSVEAAGDLVDRHYLFDRNVLVDRGIRWWYST